MSDEEEMDCDESQKYENGALIEKSFICEVCHKRFSQSSARSRCRRQHKIDNNEIEPHRCTLCGAQFVRSDHLTKHIEKHNNFKNNKRKATSSKTERIAKNVKNAKNDYVTKEELKVEFQALRDQLASSVGSISFNAGLLQKACDPEFVGTNEIFYCQRCKSVFESSNDIEEHDTTCVQKYGLIHSNFRDGVVEHLVRNFSHELTVAVLTQRVVDSSESKPEIKNIAANSNICEKNINPSANEDMHAMASKRVDSCFSSDDNPDTGSSSDVDSDEDSSSSSDEENINKRNESDQFSSKSNSAKNKMNASADEDDDPSKERSINEEDGDPKNKSIKFVNNSNSSEDELSSPANEVDIHGQKLILTGMRNNSEDELDDDPENTGEPFATNSKSFEEKINPPDGNATDDIEDKNVKDSLINSGLHPGQGSDDPLSKVHAHQFLIPPFDDYNMMNGLPDQLFNHQ